VESGGAEVGTGVGAGLGGGRLLADKERVRRRGRLHGFLRAPAPAGAGGPNSLTLAL